MRKNNQIINIDFQGWPVYKQSLREILAAIGLTKLSNRSVDYWQIADNDPILDCYPVTLEDDGMGYGVNEKFITEVDKLSNKNLQFFITEDLSYKTVYLEDKVYPGYEFTFLDKKVYILDIKEVDKKLFYSCKFLLNKEGTNEQNLLIPRELVKEALKNNGTSSSKSMENS